MSSGYYNNYLFKTAYVRFIESKYLYQNCVRFKHLTNDVFSQVF